MIPAAHRVSSEELVEALGLVDALRFVERFSGARVHVPRHDRITERGLVASTLGIRMVSQLALRWAGREIEVPSGGDYLVRRRSLEIHRERAWLTVQELAMKYELGEAEVRQILATPALDLLAARDDSTERGLESP